MKIIWNLYKMIYTYTECAVGGGTYETAQSDLWSVNDCGTFSERTHCGGQQSGQTICSTGGVLVEYSYSFDQVCCGDCTIQNGGGSSNTPSPVQNAATPDLQQLIQQIKMELVNQHQFQALVDQLLDQQHIVLTRIILHLLLLLQVQLMIQQMNLQLELIQVKQMN